MPSFDVAHIRKQGQNLIIFPLDASFGHKSSEAQENTLLVLEAHAHAAGLAGTAVAIWDDGRHTHTLGPTPWRPFLESIDMYWVEANLNKEISWPG